MDCQESAIAVYLHNSELLIQSSQFFCLYGSASDSQKGECSLKFPVMSRKHPEFHVSSQTKNFILIRQWPKNSFETRCLKCKKPLSHLIHWVPQWKLPDGCNGENLSQDMGTEKVSVNFMNLEFSITNPDLSQ